MSRAQDIVEEALSAAFPHAQTSLVPSTLEKPNARAVFVPELKARVEAMIFKFKSSRKTVDLSYRLATTLMTEAERDALTCRKCTAKTELRPTGQEPIADSTLKHLKLDPFPSR